MLMENTLQLEDRDQQKLLYDLKGSTYTRVTKGKLTNKTTRKDLDFTRDKNLHKDLLNFSAENQKLIKVIRRDVAYLKARGLLDYSLLMCVENSHTFNPLEISEERRKTQEIIKKK